MNRASGHRVLTWRRLVVAAAVGLVVLSLGQAVLRGDREALLLVVVIVVGLVLLGRGRGTLGAVFLSLVFGDFLIWTMWAAMNNLRHGEEPEDITLPAVLAVLSLTGLVACWMALARRRQPQAGGPAVALTPAAAIFVVGMLLGFAVAYPEAPETQHRGAVVTIETRNAAYSTTSLAAPSGQVTVVLTNHDLFWHTFTVDELHVDVEAPLGGAREATFTAPASAATNPAIPTAQLAVSTTPLATSSPRARTWSPSRYCNSVNGTTTTAAMATRVRQCRW